MRAAQTLGRNLRVAAGNMGRGIAVAIKALGHNGGITAGSRRQCHPREKTSLPPFIPHYFWQTSQTEPRGPQHSEADSRYIGVIAFRRLLRIFNKTSRQQWPPSAFFVPSLSLMQVLMNFRPEGFGLRVSSGTRKWSLSLIGSRSRSVKSSSPVEKGGFLVMG